MNPFANPADAVTYDYVEFPRPKVSGFSLEDFNQDFSPKEATSSSHFVDFLNLKDLPEEKITTVQLAVFQNFKDVLLPVEG